MTYNLLLTGTRWGFVNLNVSEVKPLFISRLLYVFLSSISMAGVKLQVKDLLRFLWLKFSAVNILYSINSYVCRQVSWFSLFINLQFAHIWFVVSAIYLDILKKKLPPPTLCNVIYLDMPLRIQSFLQRLGIGLYTYFCINTFMEILIRIFSLCHLDIMNLWAVLDWQGNHIIWQ